MQLKSFAYSEHDDAANVWKLSRFDLQQINLFVGLNTAGKSRILNCMSAISALIHHPPKKLFASGAWECEFDNDGQKYQLCIKIKDSLVVMEELKVDGKIRLNRDKNGVGEIWAEKLKQNLEFKVPKESLVTHTRRDEVQHSFLEPLFLWAESVRKYSFGTEFGKHNLYAVTKERLELDSDESRKSIDPNQVVQLYTLGFQKFNDSFDKDILDDLAQIGYDCEKINASPMQGITAHQFKETVPILVLSVQERDLLSLTFQNEMSMGMYRALALLINLNFIIKSKLTASIFIDDIGEGLDFERSTSLIRLLITKCKDAGVQLIMATNDRFIMNNVDLEHWHIVHRNGSDVRILDYSNSKEQFDNFKFLGLSNFDFFSDQILNDSVK